MDFVTGLPKTTKSHDAIWVVIDRLTESAHFIPIKTTISLEQVVNLYDREVIRLHGAPKSFVSDGMFGLLLSSGGVYNALWVRN